MTVKEIQNNILVLEYRQDENDEHYGSCLWARFYFNLDRYELMIMSDCGNYGYKWYETPKSESFLQLMARCSGGYIKDKIYGSPKVFDYDATKEHIYYYFEDDPEGKEKLDAIFEEIEIYGSGVDEAGEFLRVFEDNNDGYFSDIWEYIVYTYPADVDKICEVFENCIRPKIREIVRNSE